MRGALFTLVLLSGGLIACQQSSSADGATYFVTPGMTAPETADLSKGDVPRDSYGRPYFYEGLGQPVAEFAGELETGGAFASSDLIGQWTVIEVWGIWCHDSRRDAPYAAELSLVLAENADIGFMSVHTPQNAMRASKALKSYASISAWYDEKGYSMPTVVDQNASIRDALKIRWTPTYLLIAPDLTVQGFRTGLADTGDNAVEGFIADIQAVRTTWGADQGR